MKMENIHLLGLNKIKLFMKTSLVMSLLGFRSSNIATSSIILLWQGCTLQGLYYEYNNGCKKYTNNY
jgi:hypothetical protein